MAQVLYEVVKKPLFERIEYAACIYWGIEVDDLKNTGKSKAGSSELVSYRRGIVYHLIKYNTSLSFGDIAKRYNYSNHQPVHRLVENTEAQKNILKQVCNDMNQIILIADKLDAEFVTVNVQLHTNKPVIKNALH